MLGGGYQWECFDTATSCGSHAQLVGSIRGGQESVTQTSWLGFLFKYKQNSQQEGIIKPQSCPPLVTHCPQPCP